MNRSGAGPLAASALTGLPGAGDVSAGQDEAAQGPPPDPLALTIDFAYRHLFETDIDGGGEVDIARVPLVIDAEPPIADDLELVTTLRYELNLYDFSGVSDLGPEPWDDIHTPTLTTRLRRALNP